MELHFAVCEVDGMILVERDRSVVRDGVVSESFRNLKGMLLDCCSSKWIQDQILIKNKFIGVSVEKGCWGHISLLLNEPKTAEPDKFDIWLDIANS